MTLHARTVGPSRRKPRPVAPAEAGRGPTLTQPRFMARFTCLGETCPDTCCTGWTIDVEPAVARRYRAHPDPAWRARLAEALLDRHEPGRPTRTIVRLDGRGRCPLLCGDGLCSVHAELGEDWLPGTCRAFPRLEVGDARSRYRTGSIACVEIARRVLFEPDALEETSEGDPLATIGERRPGERPPTGPLPSVQEAAWIRSTMLGILARRDLPWSARVALFCVTLQDLGRIDLVRRRGDLVDLLLRTRTVLARADVADFDTVFPASHERLVAAFVPILRVLSEAGARDPVIGPTMRALAEPVWHGLAGEDRTATALATTYARAARERLEPELAARPGLPGNLYGALLLQHGFPTGRPAAAVEAAWRAGFFLAIWKVATVASMVADGKGFEAAAVEVAYRLGRALAHWPAAEAFLRADFARRGALQPAVLATLLR